MTFVLGITGSIATGKSTVVDVFKAHHIPVIDGDIVARKIVEPGQPALRAVVEYFGEGILQADGALDRQKLGEIVFSDSKERLKLDAILDPYLRGAIIGDIKSREEPLVIADIPLMFEKGYEDTMDEVAVVYVPREVQLARLMTRDGLDEVTATKKIQSQMSIEAKAHKADFIFDNTGTKAETQQQVENWLQEHRF